MKHEYKIDDRVVRTDYETSDKVPAGTKGTVRSVDKDLVAIKWDNIGPGLYDLDSLKIKPLNELDTTPRIVAEDLLVEVSDCEDFSKPRERYVTSFMTGGKVRCWCDGKTAEYWGYDPVYTMTWCHFRPIKEPTEKQKKILELQEIIKNAQGKIEEILESEE